MRDRKGQMAAPNARPVPKNTSGVPSPPPGGRRRDMAIRGETLAVLGTRLDALCSVCKRLAIARVSGPGDAGGFCCDNERCAMTIVTHLKTRERCEIDDIQFEMVKPIVLPASQFRSFLRTAKDV